MTDRWLREPRDIGMSEITEALQEILRPTAPLG